MTKRIKYCDALKALAIIFVILIHVLAVYRDVFINSNRVYYFFLSLLDSIDRIAVPSFFMITGILMLNKKPENDYLKYLRKRMPKLIITFTIFSLVYYISSIYKTNEQFLIFNFIRTFLSYGGVYYHLWFMYEIIRIYILIPFLYPFIKSLKKNEIKNLIITIFILGNVVNFIYMFTSRYNHTIFTGIPLSSLAICINYLFLGYYLHKYEIKKNTRKKFYIAGIISTLLIPVADLFYITNMRNDNMFTVNSIFLMLPASAVFLLFKYNYDKLKMNNKVENIIKKISNNTLYIYMIHVIILEFIMKYIHIIITPNRLINILILIPITLILSFIISFILYLLIDFLYNKTSNLITNILKKTKVNN